jgi:transcriptional regulator with XRE-family HTH domain
MKGYKALDFTIDIFHIQAKSLAEKVGISPVQLSRYRNGKSDLYGETLLRILRALPPEAKGYYWLLTMSEHSNEIELADSLERIS